MANSKFKLTYSEIFKIGEEGSIIPPRVSSVHWSPQELSAVSYPSMHVLACTGDFGIQIFHGSERIYRLDCDEVTCCDWNPKVANLVAFGLTSGAIMFLQFNGENRSFDPLDTYYAKIGEVSKKILSLSWDSSGQYLLACTSSHIFVIKRSSSRRWQQHPPIELPSEAKERVVYVKCNPSAIPPSFILCGPTFKKIQVWELQKEESSTSEQTYFWMVVTDKDHIHGVQCLSAYTSTEMAIVATTGAWRSSQAIHIWDVGGYSFEHIHSTSRLELLCKIDIEDRYRSWSDVLSMSWSRDDILAVGCDDGTAYVYYCEIEMLDDASYFIADTELVCKHPKDGHWDDCNGKSAPITSLQFHPIAFHRLILGGIHGFIHEFELHKEATHSGRFEERNLVHEKGYYKGVYAEQDRFEEDKEEELSDEDGDEEDQWSFRIRSRENYKYMRPSEKVRRKLRHLFFSLDLLGTFVTRELDSLAELSAEIQEICRRSDDTTVEERAAIFARCAYIMSWIKKRVDEATKKRLKIVKEIDSIETSY